MKNVSRLIVGLGIAVSLTVVGAGSVSAAAHRHVSGPPVYLALGDSVGAGYQTSSIPTDRACSDAVNDVSGQRGFTCLLYRRMLTQSPTMQFASLALAVGTAHGAGEDSCSFQSVTNCEGDATRVDGAPGDTPPWDINASSQLTQAEGYIATHNVQVISLNLGGNDFLPLLAIAEMPSCPPYPNCVAYAQSLIPTVGARLGNNMATIVGTLKAVDPTATILVGDQYNPLSGLPSTALGPNGALILGLAQSALQAYQSAIKTITTATSTIYVDEYDLFTNIAPAVTWITSGQNIHPNARGYTLLANTFWQVYVESTGGEKIKVKASKRLKSGKRQTFTITTLPGSTVTTTITYRAKGWSYTATKTRTLTGVATRLAQTWKPPAGVRGANYNSCSTLGTGVSAPTKCAGGRFIIA